MAAVGNVVLDYRGALWNVVVRPRHYFHLGISIYIDISLSVHP